MAKSQHAGRDNSSHQLAAKRLSDRLIEYLKKEVKDPSSVISSLEVAQYLKIKFHEYNRIMTKMFETRCKVVIDTLYADVNATNIRKPFYKKSDLIKVAEKVGEDVQSIAATAPIYIDKYGEELVDHKSQNTMNTFILNNQAKQNGDAVLGKRSRSEVGDNDQSNDGTEQLPNKRRKTKASGSMADYLKNKDQSSKAEELLNTLRVAPGHNFSEMGGL